LGKDWLESRGNCKYIRNSLFLEIDIGLKVKKFTKKAGKRYWEQNYKKE
jgi:hypothetical protein